MTGQVSFAGWDQGDYLSLVEVIVAVGGFWLAVRQLKKSTSATKQTTAAVTALQSRLASNDLLVSLPGLHSAEDELDSAIKSGNGDDIRSTLLLYARGAQSCVAMLQSNAAEESTCIDLLESAVKAVMKARDDIAKSGAKPSPRELALKAGAKVSAASVEVAAVIVRLKGRG